MVFIMTANELANELDAYGEFARAGESPFKEHAKMLRKQAEEIEHLKELFEKAMRMIEK
jgi:hypothetical protein